MSEKKDIVELQHEIKQNANELQDYLRDLNNWEEEINRKDEELRKKKGIPIEQLPPIRSNSTDDKKSEDMKRHLENSSKKGNRISAFDYKSWDQFDVEEACREIDESTEKKLKIASNESEESSSEDDNEEADDVVRLRNKQQAIMEKDKGNEFFKAGNYDKAIECYSKGMLCDSTNAMISANRAMALLKKSQYAAAEIDCDAALKADPTYVKAYHRRATARKSLGKLSLAKEDLQKILKFEPTNKQILGELEALEKLILSKNDEVEPKSQSGELVKFIKNQEKHRDDGIVFPISKPEHTQSKKPLKRIPIEEIELGDQQCTEEIPIIINKCSTSITPLHSPLTPTLTVPSAPKTYFQFKLEWEKLRKNPEFLYVYIKEIEPSNYSSLFQESLESEMLSDFLKTFQDYYLRDSLDVYLPLVSLASVKRFKTLALFLSNKDKQVIHRLIEVIRDEEKCKLLKSLYEL